MRSQSIRPLISNWSALLASALCIVVFGASNSRGEEPSAAQKVAVASEYGKLPLRFEANKGQNDSTVRYSARGSGYSLFLTDSTAVLALSKKAAQGQKSGDLETDVVRMELKNAAPGVHASGIDQLPGNVNYLIGSDPANWHRDVPTFAKVKYSGVYPGIDLVYYGKQGNLEYDFVVSPGTDPSPARLHFSGAKSLTLDGNGDLRIATAHGAISFHKPVVYQVAEDGKREEVSGRFRLLASNDVGFTLGIYDRKRELVIDPALYYSTYLGGTGNGGGGDYAYGIAVDGSGDAYVTGMTFSSNFPVKNAAFPTFHTSTFACPGYGVDNSEAFITKFNATGNAEVYSTYLGGSGGDSASAIAVDNSGNAFVTGYTCSTNFPHYNTSYQTTNKGAANHVPVAFASEISPAGNELVYSTYLGGSGGDKGNGIAVDDVSDAAFIIGTTYSSDFPVTPGAYQTTNKNATYKHSSVFVTQVGYLGEGLVYSTYLGPTGSDLTADSAGDVTAGGIALDSATDAYLTGATNTRAFPTTANAYQTSLAGYPSAFFTKLDLLGTYLNYSTYLGGDFGAGGNAIAVDGSGDAYLAGYAYQDFPITTGAAQTQYKEQYDGSGPAPTAFAAKFNPNLGGNAALIYSTYLGGSGYYDQNDDGNTPGDIANGIAVDSSGVAYVTGSTYSHDFPVAGTPYQSSNPDPAGRFSAFYTQVAANGESFPYSTYLGGNSGDSGQAIAVDGSGSTYLAGFTYSSNFPTYNAFQNKNKAGFDGTAFVTKFGPSLRRFPIPWPPSPICIPCILQFLDSVISGLSLNDLTFN